MAAHMIVDENFVNEAWRRGICYEGALARFSKPQGALLKHLAGNGLPAYKLTRASTSRVDLERYLLGRRRQQGVAVRK